MRSILQHDGDKNGPHIEGIFIVYRAGSEGRTDLMPSTRWDKRVDAADWTAIAAAVDDYGGALLPRLLTPAETQRLRNLYTRDQLFRATIDMGPRRYGSGQYRYFRAPYPGTDRAPQTGAVSAAVAHRPGLVGQAGPRCAVAGQPRRMAGYVSCRRPEEIDGPGAQVRDERLECPAPRPVRGLGVSASSGDQPQ